MLPPGLLDALLVGRPDVQVDVRGLPLGLHALLPGPGGLAARGTAGADRLVLAELGDGLKREAVILSPASSLPTPERLRHQNHVPEK